MREIAAHGTIESVARKSSEEQAQRTLDKAQTDAAEGESIVAEYLQRKKYIEDMADLLRFIAAIDAVQMGLAPSITTATNSLRTALLDAAGGRLVSDVLRALGRLRAVADQRREFATLAVPEAGGVNGKRPNMALACALVLAERFNRAHTNKPKWTPNTIAALFCVHNVATWDDYETPTSDEQRGSVGRLKKSWQRCSTFIKRELSPSTDEQPVDHTLLTDEEYAKILS